MLKLGHDFNAFVRNAMIDMYARLGPIGHGRLVFDEIPNHERKVADLNAMISRYWKWESEDQVQ